MEELVQAIARLVHGVSGVGALAVFGSRARGDHRPDSDLDVAVLPARDLGGDRLKLQARIASALSELAPEGRVDVVLLDEAPELLRHRVFADCRMVMLREPERWKELRRRTMREHGDREPYRRLLREALHARLQGGA